MPATPASLSKNGPPKSTPRLFVDQPLSCDQMAEIDGNAAHYLANVMRLKEGAPVKLFDDRSGEYLAHVISAAKRKVSLAITEKLREREAVPDLWLVQALVKKDRLDWIAEKSCELGIARFVPVLTNRCVVDKAKDDRLRSQMIEASEQCERTALPEIAQLTKLDALLASWPPERILFFCDERGGDNFAASVKDNAGPAALIIGPEGGFTDQENAAIRAHPNARAVSLGPRILRADTAAVTAISAWMAQAPGSDWG
ncbi:16S rRNA (uracil(1498)-N(3))-methyltransferase [Sphingorhabdus arenilitoris]|uniref:Ribosomal RNA small subunit methyltransferase E n=1 Tax=Sphingorhabdus arenilitoris TaxID=1490041 RepID=A0ABV8RIJ8_9SPHN